MARPTEELIASVRAIIAAAEASDVHELEVRSSSLRLSIRRAPGGYPLPEVRTLPGLAPSVDSGTWHVVECPITGIWYDSASPGGAPYVSVGDAVATGSVLGLVETMKVFNEVTAEIPGIVRQVFVHRGDLVAAHAPLLAIDPSSDGILLPGSDA